LERINPFQRGYTKGSPHGPHTIKEVFEEAITKAPFPTIINGGPQGNKKRS